MKALSFKILPLLVAIFFCFSPRTLSLVSTATILFTRKSEAWRRSSSKVFSLVRAAHSGECEYEHKLPKAFIKPTYSGNDDHLSFVLSKAGFECLNHITDDAYVYTYVKASNMLKLLSRPEKFNGAGNDAPQWVPLVSGEENVLVANGWSFLDPDDSEPLSAYDIDAANAEGLYKPKWTDDAPVGRDQRISKLGYSLEKMHSNDVLNCAAGLQRDLSRNVLLEGGTDPLNLKTTHNHIPFSGSAGQSDIPKGVFCCAIGSLPLFASTDLSPATGSSGWLSFSRPLSNDHLCLIEPKPGAEDQRTEVVCAKSGCHLGHFFGRSEGFCINASALDFYPIDSETFPSRPTSGLALFGCDGSSFSPSVKMLQVLVEKSTVKQIIVLGGGCFWHIEYALRRLGGVTDTVTGYSGGNVSNPSYQEVSDSKLITGHAEVVRVEYDATVLPTSVLLDCFMALHDPTKVRAHGKHAKGSGQYRSYISVTNNDMEHIAYQVIENVRNQLGKEVITEVRVLNEAHTSGKFWRAEEKHQRHNEQLIGSRRKSNAPILNVDDWIMEYGRRAKPIHGTSETITKPSFF